MKRASASFCCKLSILAITLVTGFSVFLQAEEINYKTLFNRVSPSVVLVFGHDGKNASKGTGSIIEGRGLILTNTHVVLSDDKPWKYIFIYLKPEKLTGDSKKDMKRAFAAKIVALNPGYDLAILQMINPPNNLQPLPLLDNINTIGPGEATAAIGHPGGGAAWTLTTGRISSIRENYNNIKGWDVIQTQTPLNPGNSGGPLLDGNGTIIGINTFIVRQGKGGMALEGLNYAVTAATARKWVIEVIGKLPDGPQKQVEQVKNPEPVKVAKAKPPSLKKSATVKPFIVQKSTEEKSKVELPKAPEKSSFFTSKMKSGQEFLGKEFDEKEFMKPFKSASFD
jgi:S1-C subfamily serine protease